MGRRILAAVLGLAMGFALGSAEAAKAADADDAVLGEINLARAHPADYARLLQQQTGLEISDGSSGGQGDADPQAFNEAIDFLMGQRPLPPLARDPRLVAAARSHAAEQARTGGVGHGSETGEGLGERLHRFGLWAGLAAEDISYGYESPRQVVEQLILDSGVAGRGHRQTLFDPTLRAAGVGCDRHSAYGAVCVIDFAGAIVQR